MVARRSWCQYCTSSADDCDAKTSEPGQHYVCTREAGHKGDHVACGTFQHNAKRWPNREPLTGDSDLG